MIDPRGEADDECYGPDHECRIAAERGDATYCRNRECRWDEYKEARAMTAMTVDRDARWIEIQKLSTAISLKDEAPTETEAALCGAVVRAREALEAFTKERADHEACKLQAAVWHQSAVSPVSATAAPPSHARAVALEEAAQLCESFRADQAELVSSIGVRLKCAERIRAYAATLPDAPQPAQQMSLDRALNPDHYPPLPATARSEPVAWLNADNSKAERPQHHDDTVGLARAVIVGDANVKNVTSAGAYAMAESLAYLAALSETPARAERKALAFFMATAFADGYFDDDGDQPLKERVRAWLLQSANRIRDDITVQEVVEAIIGPSSSGQEKSK